MSSNRSQVWGIPCFGKSIDFQGDLFRQSFAGVGNSIFWQFLRVFRGIYLNRCGKLLVLANPLTFNGICFDKAFPFGNNFISLFFTGSLFLLQAYTFNGQLFRLSPFGGIGGPERTVILFVSAIQALSPWILLASWMSFGMMVTHLACIAHRLVSLNNPTKYASAASCRAIIAALWNLTLPHRGDLITSLSLAISCTNHWKGSFLIKSSVDF